jgi:hypothetical protein
MACALALPILAGLVHAASVDAALGIRAESVTTTVGGFGAPERSRATASVTPSATAVAEGSTLRLRGTYAPRLWTPDLSSGDAPVVDHVAEARLETRAEEPDRAQATVRAVRGWTDPLGDLSRTTAANAQLASDQSYAYEDLRAELRGGLSLGERTAIGAGAAYGLSRAVEPQPSLPLPPQRAIALDGSLTRLVSERDSLVASRARPGPSRA